MSEVINHRLQVFDEENKEIPLFFNTKYNWDEEVGELNSGDSIVDPSGYIPAKARIENLIRAGEQLDSYRRELYHYGSDDTDDGFTMDPMQSPGLDPADVSRMNREAMARLRTRQDASSVRESVPAQSEAKKAEADPSQIPSQLAQEASPAPSN